MAWKNNINYKSNTSKAKNHLRNTYFTLATAVMLAGWLQGCKNNSFNGNEQERQEILTKASKLAGHKYVILTSDWWKAEKFATINTLQDGSLQIFTNTKVIMINPKTKKIESNDHVTFFSQWKEIARDEKVDNETVKNIVDMCINWCSQFSVSYEDADTTLQKPATTHPDTTSNTRSRKQINKDDDDRPVFWISD